MNTTNTAQFTNKYTHGGKISRWLIERFFRALAKNVAQVKPQTILEVGCGPGYSTEVLQHTAPNARIQACDIDEDLLTLTRAKAPQASAQIDDIHQLSYASSSVDLVVCLEVLEHVAHPAQALRELARVTKTYAILSVPREPIWRMLNMLRGAYWSDWGNTPGHINHWSTTQFVAFARDHFDVIAIHQPLPWTMLLLKKRASSNS